MGKSLTDFTGVITASISGAMLMGAVLSGINLHELIKNSYYLNSYHSEFVPQGIVLTALLGVGGICFGATSTISFYHSYRSEKKNQEEH